MQNNQIEVGDDPIDANLKLPLNRFNCNVHQCSSKCIKSEVPSGILNPLLLPFYYGFLRHFLKMPQVKKDTVNEFNIVYSTPCGKVLKSYGQIKSYLMATDLKELDVDNFTFSENFMLSKCKTNYKSFMDDISDGKEKWPISLVNVIDDQVLFTDFEYTSSRQFHEELDTDTGELPNFSSCCSCENNCEDFFKCECQQLTFQESGNKSFGYRYKRLYHQHKSGIYECNSNCKCNTKCPNRVVQAGINFQLQIFRSVVKGWAVRSPHFIPKGTYISSYHGQVVDDEIIDSKKIKDDYLAIMDLIDSAEIGKDGVKDVTTSKEIEEGVEISLRSALYETKSKYLMDGSKLSNVGRFYNHSCDPNMFVQNVFIETHDLRFHHLAFFALRDITPFEELTWDYNFGYVGSDAFVDCKCESNYCRYRLF